MTGKERKEKERKGKERIKLSYKRYECICRERGASGIIRRDNSWRKAGVKRGNVRGNVRESSGGDSRGREGRVTINFDLVGGKSRSSRLG
jgi:hypothetical protein